MSNINSCLIEPYLEKKRDQVDHYLKKWVCSLDDVPDKLVQSISYSLTDGGKRIRPALLLSTVAMLEGDEEIALPFACAIEMIHTYSLIHDDLPCMDDDHFRRGKPSNHIVFGEALALLAGDSLLTEAFGLMTKNTTIQSDILLRILREGVFYTGAKGMVGGQVLDVHPDLSSRSEHALEQVYLKKTANLLIYSVRTGAHVSHASTETLEKLTQFATYLGLSFQIQDDLLDEPDSDETNKNMNTYVSTVGLKRAKQKVAELTHKAKSCIQELEFKNKSTLLQIADYLLSREH